MIIGNIMFAWNNLALTGQIYMKFASSVFFENLTRKFKFY